MYHVLFNSLKMTKNMSEGVAEMLRSAQAFTQVTSALDLRSGAGFRGSSLLIGSFALAPNLVGIAAVDSAMSRG